MEPMRILLVDDHALVRSAVRQALAADDLEIVGEAATADDALLLAPRLRPDLILLDIDLPGTDGIRLVRELTPRLPDTRIVMLTVSTSRRDLLEAMQSGAAGYLTKDLSPDALQRAVRGIRRGDLPMSRQMAATVVQHLTSSRGSSAASGGNGGMDLSSREEQVLRLLAEGLTDREIGERLVISPRTVETHVGNLLRKLGVRNRAQAAQRYRARM
jgi:DNA-binding NarL/FixJ family response regulator